MSYTYAELFAGAGGLSLGLEAAGFHAAAHAEIEPHARAVLRRHWPTTRLDGDVAQINGADYAGITLLSGGSPCQDLSVAGKRAGLTGSRSSLFHEQVRIWHESGAPYFLWENVNGALSSQHGRDFATVLSTLVGAAIPVPTNGWQRAGVAAGPAAVAAWRVLDLQHFGPPQRRVRVFVLAARTGGVDPAEVLALSEGVCGHPSPRQQARESLAASTGGGAKGGDCVGAFQNTGQGWWNKSDVAQTLRTPSGGDSTLANVLAFESTCGSNGVVTIGLDGEKNAHIKMMGTLNTGSKGGSGQQPVVLAFESTGGSWGVNEGDTAPPIKIGTGLQIASPPAVVEVVQTLVVGGRDKGAGDSYDNTPVTVQCVTGHVTHALTHEGADASEDGTGRGTPITVQEVFTKQQYGAYTESTDVSSTIGARDHAATNVDIAVVGTLDVHDSTKWGSHQWVAQDKAMVTAGRPRRLTPLECERLMSWPDHWTATGIKEDGTKYALSDTARYRLCGNGVGSVQVQWIAEQLMAALRAQPICRTCQQPIPWTPPGRPPVRCDGCVPASILAKRTRTSERAAL